MRMALDSHNARCSEPAHAILLNPIDHGLLGWDELWGLPVVASEDVKIKRIRIECDGEASDEVEREVIEHPEA
jgi:hypothetical protein